MVDSLILAGVAVVLGLMTSGLWSLFRRASERWLRPLGIALGGMLGVTASIPLAILLNPLVGLQRGTFHNLGIITLCLAFLGFCMGSLGGLVYAGMIQSPSPRNESDSSPSLTPEQARELDKPTGD